jgi:hypothetical protein
VRCGNDFYLFAAFLANLLAQAIGDLSFEVGHVLEHVLQEDDVAHRPEPARLTLALATQDAALAAGLSPAAAVGVGLFATPVHLDAQGVGDARLVGAEAAALGPAVLAHEALGEACLAGAAGSLLGRVWVL